LRLVVFVYGEGALLDIHHQVILVILHGGMHDDLFHFLLEDEDTAVVGSLPLWRWILRWRSARLGCIRHLRVVARSLARWSWRWTLWLSGLPLLQNTSKYEGVETLGSSRRKEEEKKQQNRNATIPKEHSTPS